MTIAAIEARLAAIHSRFNSAPVPAAGFADALGAAGATLGGTVVAGPGGVLGTGLVAGGSPASDGGERDVASGPSIVASAKQHLGVPYVWGGEDPSGFDCSGLVQYVYRQHGIDVPRVTWDQAKAGRPVTTDQLQAGDLVFFGPLDHVGIYAGDGTMVVAPKRGDVVKVQPVDLSAVTAARRILPDASSATALPATWGVGGGGGWQANLPAAAQPFTGAIQRAADAAGIDPRLVAAVAWTESGFRPDARSAVGATGLMQLMPGTAAGLGVDAGDPAANLAGGARYLAAQLQRFGRLDLALAAYNAGPGAVAQHGGVPPYAETQAYVQRVTDRFRSLGGVG